MSSSEIMKVRLTADGIQEVIAALKKVEGAVKTTKKSSEGMGSNLRNELRDLGIGVALQQLGRFVKANIEAQAAVQDLVEVSGASAEAISVLGIAAKKEGVSMEGLQKGIKGATKFMAALQEGSGEAAKTLSDIGLSAKDLVGKNLDEQLITIANALDQFSDEGQSGMNKTAIAMKIFGKNGGDMLQVMQRLSGDGFKQLQEEGLKTGQVLSGEAALAAKKAKEEMANLEGQVTGLVNAFTQGLIPALGDATNGLMDVSNPDSMVGFKKLGEFVGWVAKGIVSAFIVVGQTVGTIINAIATHFTNMFNDMVNGLELLKKFFTAPSRDFVAAFKAYKITTLQGGQYADMWEDYTSHLGDTLDKMWNPAKESSPAAVKPKGKGTKPLTIPNKVAADKAAKAASTESLAAAKRELDASKQTLDEFNKLNEHYHDQELIDLEDYLEGRHQAIAYAGEIEIKALRDQIEAEKLLGKDASQTKLADLNAEIELKKKATAASLLEDTWKAGEDRKKAKETAFSRAGSALDVSNGQLNLGLSGVDSQRAQGLISENEAIRQKIELYRQYIPLLAEEARLQLEAAQATGDAGSILKAQENIAAVGELKVKFGELGDQMKWLKDTAKDAATSGLAEFFMSLGDQTDSLSDKIRALGRSIAQAVMQAAAMKMATAMMGGMGFASGGPVFGAGTATSDSIQARLSTGEFVMRAAAVKHYGLGTMAALNGLSMPRSSRPGFADGGLVGGGAQPQTFKSEVNGTIAVRPPDGWYLEVLKSPEAVRIMAENSRSNAKRFNSALGRR